MNKTPRLRHPFDPGHAGGLPKETSRSILPDLRALGPRDFSILNGPFHRVIQFVGRETNFMSTTSNNLHLNSESQSQPASSIGRAPGDPLAAHELCGKTILPSSR
jgi:hypothetical protein